MAADASPIDATRIKVRAFLDDVLVVFDQIDSIAQPHMFRGIERRKRDYRHELKAAAKSSEELNPASATDLLDAIENQLIYYSAVTVGPGLNSGRAGYVPDENAFEMESVRPQLVDLFAHVQVLKIAVHRWASFAGTGA